MMKFGSNKQNEEDTNASKVTVLSLGFELTGDVISKNDIRADGILCGNIRTDKRVVVGEKASITGDILADEISISGEVIGDLYINRETTIYSTARVSGKIITNQIFIHKGAELDTCIKTASVESIKKQKHSTRLNSPELVKTYSLLDSKEEKAEEETEKKEEMEATIEPINKNFHRSW